MYSGALQAVLLAVLLEEEEKDAAIEEEESLEARPKIVTPHPQPASKMIGNVGSENKLPTSNGTATATFFFFCFCFFVSVFVSVFVSILFAAFLLTSTVPPQTQQRSM